MTLPVVYTTTPAEVKAAVANIRSRLRNLAEPRLYHTAVALTVLYRTGRATEWRSWDTPPPVTAVRFGRRELIGAMWEMFGTKPHALLRADAPLLAQMNRPSRVMLDVLYGANGPLTLVGNMRVAADSRRDSAKLELDDSNWLWGATTSQVRLAEYNPVNTIYQQNGIGCAWPTSEAVGDSPPDPAAIYGVDRAQCPKRRNADGKEPTCAINGAVCGGQGDGAARAVTKPRLLAPPSPQSEAYVVLPESVKMLVAQATRGGKILPLASDLSLYVSWCHTGGSGTQDATRLPSLLGAQGLRLLTSTT